MATVDTSSEKLTLFVAMSTSASQDALQQRMLKPEFFMGPTTERAWIPMNKSPEEALKRPERGENDVHPKRDYRVVQIGKHGVSTATSMKQSAARSLVISSCS